MIKRMWVHPWFMNPASVDAEAERLNRGKDDIPVLVMSENMLASLVHFALMYGNREDDYGEIAQDWLKRVGLESELSEIQGGK